MELRERGRKRKRSVRAPDDLLEKIVLEILLRLPVKDLLRYKSVCKAWRAIISDPIFIKAQLRCSASRWKQEPSFVISPHCIVPGETIPPTLFSNHIRFYQLKHDASPAKFLHDRDFGELTFSRVRTFASCDGLVFAPTDTKLYLFNPATRECVALPESKRNNLWYGGDYLCYCAGLGLDPRSGRYKIVQAFYRSRDPNIYDTGMEVFTIGGRDGGYWREMKNDLPHPAVRSQTGLCVKGFMFWHMNRDLSTTPPWGLLRLDLADETFSVTAMPDTLDPCLAADYPDDGEGFYLDVVCDELCLTSKKKSGNNFDVVRIIGLWPIKNYNNS